MQKNIWLSCKYLRLSIDDGDKSESDSIVNQSIMIDSFLRQREDITIVDTFKDDGFTGTDFNRPGFIAMMEAIERKEINCVIVKDLSRFGREHIDVDRYIQKIFPALGVRFIAINDNYDSLTASITDKHLVLPVKSFVNDTYSRQNSQRIRSHLQAKRDLGHYVGSYVAYGYLKSSKNKNEIEIDPFASKYVKQIFQWKKDGLSSQQIANELNDLGVLAPADYKRSRGINYKSPFQTHLSSKWSAVAVNRILKNVLYCGILEQGKTQRVNYKVKVQRELPMAEWAVKENNHAAIIDNHTFELVQRLNKLDTRIAPGEDKLYLFGGLLVCGDCGRNLVRRVNTYKGKQKIFYICTTYNRNEGCTRHSIKEEELITIVQNSLKMYGELTDAIKDAVIFLKNEKLDINELVMQDDVIMKQRQELDKYYKLFHSLSKSLSNRLISKQEYIAMKNAYQKRIDELETSINKQEEYLEDLLQNKFMCDKWMEQFLEKPEISSFDRDTLIHFIEKIIIYEGKKVEIIYRFQDELLVAQRLVKNIQKYNVEVTG